MPFPFGSSDVGVQQSESIIKPRVGLGGSSGFRAVEQRDSVASLTLREDNVLEVGRAEATTEEKRVGDRLRRLRRKETMGVDADGLIGRLTLN